MIKSMTGFASLTRDDERGALGVTIRSVNHRFIDLQLRLPPPIADLEPRLRAIVQKHLARGRVEISISLQLRQNTAPHIELNEEFAQALSGAMEQARGRGLVAGQLTPGDLLRLPQALIIREKLVESGLGRLRRPLEQIAQHLAPRVEIGAEVLSLAHPHPVELLERRGQRPFGLRGDDRILGVGLGPLAHGDRLRDPEQIAGRQHAAHEAAFARTVERRADGVQDRLVDLDFD